VLVTKCQSDFPDFAIFGLCMKGMNNCTVFHIANRLVVLGLFSIK
jgi:hypothetical protein